MKIAFVFPGQGSQSVGMMAGFDAHPAVRATFDEASELLGAGPVGARDGRPRSRSQPDGQHAAGDADRRRRRVARVAGRGRAASRRSSPATASASTRRWSRPARSRFATRCRSCASARRRCRTRCRRASARWRRSSASTRRRSPRSARRPSGDPGPGQVVEPVNFNAPEQVVIAGHRDAVERAIAVAAAKGAKRGVLLPVSAPFHSSLLKPAARAPRRASSPTCRSPCRRSPCCTTSTSRKGRRAGGDPRRARAAGGEPGALGRDHPGVRRARRHARRRMRAGQGARGTQQADRARPQVVCADRRHRHRRDAGGARRLTGGPGERPWRMQRSTDRWRW